MHCRFSHTHGSSPYNNLEYVDLTSQGSFAPRLPGELSPGEFYFLCEDIRPHRLRLQA